MRTYRIPALFRSLPVLALLVALSIIPFASAQAPQPKRGPMPKQPLQIKPDPRVEQRSYRFEATGETLTYVLYVSSKVSSAKKNPLIVALHGLGGDGNFLVRERVVDLAEEGGYIVVAPLGYNVGGWYGSPVIVFGGGSVEPPNLAELSEKDVMTVLGMMRKEFNIDGERTYLLGHSMGGAGALFLGSKHPSDWAAVAAIAPAAFMMQEQRKDFLGKFHAAGIPVMIVQGGKDTAVPVENTRAWATTLKEMELKHAYIEMPEGDHGTVIADGMPAIFEFFARHPKTAAK